jgi:hypothetical protein
MGVDPDIMTNLGDPEQSRKYACIIPDLLPCILLFHYMFCIMAYGA